jgi:hypothetical protein
LFDDGLRRRRGPWGDDLAAHPVAAACRLVVRERGDQKNPLSEELLRGKLPGGKVAKNGTAVNHGFHGFTRKQQGFFRVNP